MPGKVIIKKSNNGSEKKQNLSCATEKKKVVPKKIIVEEKHNLQILNDFGSDIDKIVHISDIHIYLPIDNSRYAEYMYVFNKLYDEIEELCKNYKLLICITGDLCDKNKLWGREIDFVEKFLTKLCSFAPVITIPGNHDYNYCEQDELVHIAPIMRNKNLNNKFYLLIENGLYRYNNIIFGLTAVYSDKVVPCEIDTCGTNIKKVGLYHGHVYSRKIKGIVPEKGYFRVEDFDEYDMVLLGDIHTACALSNDNSRWYAGSLIKQRINEPKDHGYILWDVKSNKGELKSIQNIYTTIMLEIDENGIKDYDKIEIPANGKVEAIYKNIDFNQAKEKLKELEQKTGINIEPHMDMEIKINDQNNENRIIKNISDLRTKEGISKVIIDYIKGRENEQKDLEYMEKIINNIIKDIIYNPDVKQKKIKIKTLKFDNFFSYGEGNVIDFEKLSNSIVNIYGRNSVGKTSIFDAILLSIYGDCTRGKAIDSINTKKKYMSTEIILDVNDDTFRITRKRTKKYEYVNKKTGKKILNKNLDGQEKTDMKVEIYKNNKLLESNKVADIDEYIAENIGKRDDFVKMCMMLQKDSYNFFDMPDSEQVNFIMKFINLDIINVIGDTIRCKINDLTREENGVLKDYKVKKLDQLKNILQIKKERIANGQKELNETREILTNTMASHMLISDKLINLNTEMLNYKSQENNMMNIDEYNKSKKEYCKKIKELTLISKQLDKLYIEKKILNDKLKQITTNIDCMGGMNDQYKLFCENKEKEMLNINSEICDLHEQKCNISIKITSFGKLDNSANNVKNMNTKLLSAKKELLASEKKRKDIDISIDKLYKNIVEIDENEYEKCVDKKNIYDEAVDGYDILKKQYNVLQDSLLNYANIDIFSKMNFNIKCKCCKANKENINHDIIIDNHNKLKIQAETVKEKMEKNKIIIDNTKEFYDLFEKFNKQRIINTELNVKIENLKKDKDLLDAKLELYNKNIEDMEQIIENIKENTLSKKKIDLINKNIKDAQNKLAKLQESKMEKYDVYKKLCEEQIKVNTLMSDINNTIIEKNTCIESMKIEIEKSKITISEYEETIEKNDKYMKIRDQIIQMNDQISDLNDKRKICEDTINTLENIIHDNDYTILENDTKKLDIIQYDKIIFNKINMYLVKDVNGIRSSILENKIFPHLEEIINSFLTQIVDYKIKFRYLGSQKLEIKKKYVNGSDVSLDTRSASEDTVLDIIFRISLAYFNNVIKCNFFIMDEVFSLFDQQRLDIVLTKIFACLKKYFDVLLIVSQLPEVQTACDNKIIVERDNEGFSKLKNLYQIKI